MADLDIFPSFFFGGYLFFSYFEKKVWFIFFIF